jgi:hypothetical protein
VAFIVSVYPPYSIGQIRSFGFDDPLQFDVVQASAYGLFFLSVIVVFLANSSMNYHKEKLKRLKAAAIGTTIADMRTQDVKVSGKQGLADQLLFI